VEPLKVCFVGMCLVGMALGCRNDSAAPAVVAPQDANHGVVAPIRSECTTKRGISKADQRVLGGAIYVAYRAALSKDADRAFQEFSRAFKKDIDRDQLRRFVWPAVRRHVVKYTAGPSDPSFNICSSKKQKMGRVKVFVESNDPKKSNPPIVMVQEDGLWKIEVMTP